MSDVENLWISFHIKKRLTYTKTTPDTRSRVAKSYIFDSRYRRVTTKHTARIKPTDWIGLGISP